MNALHWTTEKRKVKDLVQLEFNPRKITEEKKQKLLRSLEKFNLAEIPCINTDNKLIGGNQRVLVLLMAGRGEEEIDVRVPNRLLTLKEVKEYAIISNTHAGEFDWDIFDEYFSDIDLSEIGFDLPDFDWMQPFEIEAIDEDDYIIPDNIVTDIVPGDYFEIGNHRLICGDCRHTNVMDKLLGADKLNLIVTDPPYNVDYTGKTKDAMKIENDKMDSKSFYQFLLDAYSALGIYLIPGGGWYIFHADTEGHNFRQAFIDAGNKLAQTLVWVKDTMVMGRQDYHWQHEPILYGWKLGAAHNWCADRKQTTVLKYDRPTRNEEHPTMKPIPLIGYVIGNSSQAGDIIGDGFLGSGSTMVAAHQLKRRCYGVELDPKFCQVIIDRMLKLEPRIIITRNGKAWNTQKNS